MKKILAVFAALSLALNASAGTEFTFASAADLNQTKDGITLTIAIGNGQKAPVLTTDYETQQPEMRLYTGNTVSLSCGQALTDIQLVCAKSSGSNNKYTGLSANTGELVSGGEAADKNDWKIDHWTGNATSVVFTLTGTGQRRIQKIVVDGGEVVIEPEPELPTEDDLEAEYDYAEPAIVNVPDTQFFKKEYAFISDNIYVHCGQGSIIKATDSTEAYFNCNAGYSITFTASQAIKGIAIDGFVRKGFSASCDPGEISFLTDEDFDMEGRPAVVIRDIDSRTVTLSCPKQFRCYQLRVYFQENPAAIGEDDEEGLTEIPEEEKTGKLLRNGRLVILRSGKEYNALGTQL